DVDVRDVATGAEDLALTADEEHTHTRNRLGDLGHGRGDITEVVRVEGIAGLRPIEDDLGDLAAVAQLDLGHGCSFAAGHARGRLTAGIRWGLTKCRSPARIFGRSHRFRPCRAGSAEVRSG